MTTPELSAELAKKDSSGPKSVQQKIAALLASRYLRSVGAQAAVSGFHFALNIVLLRIIEPYDYGVYAFAFVLALFASAINNALISTPLAVYTPVIKDTVKREQQEALFSTLNLLLFFALIAIGISSTFTSDNAVQVSLAVTLFVATYSARQYSKSFGYARLRPLVTAVGDIAYVVAGIVFIGAILLFTQYNPPISAILLALACANLVAMFIERWRLHGIRGHWFSLKNIKSYALVWTQSRWALIGALTTLFLGQAHGLIITWSHGPLAFAPLAAGMVLFGPVRIALMTWQNMVKPELAMALSENRQEAVKAQIQKSCFLMAAAVIALGLVLYIAWPHIYALLYAKKYSDQPMGYIVCLWALITFFAAVYNAPSAALQAMKDFKVLAMASVYGALISGILVALTLYLYSPETTLFGILAAECFMAVYLIRVMLQHLKNDTP